MSKSRISLLSCDIDFTEALRARLLEVLPNEKTAIRSLMEAFEKLDRLSHKLSPETREGGVTAKYLVSTLTREFALLGKLFRVTYSSIAGGQKIQAVITINHSAAQELAVVINTLTY